jgi:hypothetical protein
MNNPHAHLRSLPPEGAVASLRAAQREATMAEFNFEAERRRFIKLAAYSLQRHLC